MSNVKETVMDVETLQEKEASGLTHTALSMCCLPNEGWSLIELKFNPLTGEVGQLVKSYTGQGKDYIIERMKIETVNRRIFDNSGNNW